MSKSDSSFEYILQELQNQKQRMDELQAENSELRRQLTDLRDGRGIFVEILGLRIPLTGATSPIEKLAYSPAERQEAEEVQEAPTMQMMPVAIEQPSPAMAAISETPRADEESVVFMEQATEEFLPAYASSFLDEDFEEDFAGAATSQIAVWNGAPLNSPQKPVNEDEKATLRRELIGSFLLE